jgi:nitrogen fixation/metabolism regulation signal transduction histidine kinase
MPPNRSRSSWPHLRRLRLLAVLCGLPGLLCCFLLLGLGDYPPRAWFTVLILLGGAWLLVYSKLIDLVVLPLQSAANMLAALREGDFSLHAGSAQPNDPLGQLMLEINQLTDVLASHRLEAIEAHALLDKVIEEIDAAVLTFDPQHVLTLANRAGLQLLGRTRDKAVGRYAAELDLDKALESPSDSVIPHPDPDREGRFLLRRGSYRVGGVVHQLLILIDVARKLREEELQAWKRILRVLGHELNNSMAPIHSISDTLGRIARKPVLDDEDREDLQDGLDTIRQRADSLNRFVREFTRLAKLPQPHLRPTALQPLVQRTAALFNDPAPEVDLCPELQIPADAALLEQALLNLIKNAVEAARETHGKVRICWRPVGDLIELHIEDSGPGIANPDNLFIPFFTTKESGSGIGLTLARQIIEAHNGTLCLNNRETTTGCRATVTLPLR